jgi:DNA modification methylase
MCDVLIKASRNKIGEDGCGGDTLVVVPFAGSGSECLSAKNNGVNFIGFEINNDYVILANQRLGL